jgi:hypothetical protein
VTFEDLDELAAPAPAPCGRPPLRQPLAETSQTVKRSDSWWMTQKPGESITERAEAERQRMSGDVIGRKVPDQIMGQYVKSSGGAKS